MGPLLFGSGDVPCGGNARRDYGVLQWGRCFLAAEIRGRHSAVDCRAREASMGPLLFGSGDLCLPRLPSGLGVRFNGPLLFGSGDECGAMGRTRIYVASMGPLLFGSGDSNVVGFDTATPDGLRWGRCFLAAEIPTSLASTRQRRTSFNGAAAFWQRR